MGIEVTPGTPTTAELDKAELEIKDEFMAGLLISSANQKRFGLLKRDLQNSYLKGQDDYPKTFKDAKRLLGNWRAPQQSSNYIKPPARNDGVAFIQSGGKTEAKATTKEKKTNSKG